MVINKSRKLEKEECLPQYRILGSNRGLILLGANNGLYYIIDASGGKYKCIPHDMVILQHLRKCTSHTDASDTGGRYREQTDENLFDLAIGHSESVARLIFDMSIQEGSIWHLMDYFRNVLVDTPSRPSVGCLPPFVRKNNTGVVTFNLLPVDVLTTNDSQFYPRSGCSPFTWDARYGYDYQGVNPTNVPPKTCGVRFLVPANVTSSKVGTGREDFLGIEDSYSEGAALEIEHI